MNTKFKLLVFLFAVRMFSAVPVSSQTVFPDYVDGSVYVKLQDTCTLELAPYANSNASLNILFALYGVNIPGITKPFPDVATSLRLSKIYKLHCSDSTAIESFIHDLDTLAIIEYAEKEPMILTTYTPNDFNSNQWHLTKINAFQAWDITHGASSVVIAIVDNAVRITHADLSANIWTNTGEIPGNLLDDDLNGYADDVHGYDVTENDNNPNPPSGVTNSSPFVHGTHTAGIASAVTDNSDGIASVGFQAKIMAVKCSPDTGNGSVLTNAYDGVYYAIRAHADIISMSWGGSGGVFLTGEEIMNVAHTAGIILIASAGNDNSNALFYPAAFNNVIAVGATDASDAKAGYSNYGSFIDVMAPGDNIYSTLAGSDNSYGMLSGTSMAVPLVAGLAALVKAVHPSFTPGQVESAIKTGCENIDAVNSGYAGQIGSGRINAYTTFVPSALAVILQEQKIPVRIFPNPCRKILYIESMSEDIHEGRFMLLNMTGQKIYAQDINPDINASGIDVNLSGISQGIYYAEIITAEGCFMTKIVKE